VFHYSLVSVKAFTQDIWKVSYKQIKEIPIEIINKYKVTKDKAIEYNI